MKAYGVRCITRISCRKWSNFMDHADRGLQSQFDPTVLLGGSYYLLKECEWPDYKGDSIDCKHFGKNFSHLTSTEYLQNLYKREPNWCLSFCALGKSWHGGTIISAYGDAPVLVGKHAVIGFYIELPFERHILLEWTKLKESKNDQIFTFNLVCFVLLWLRPLKNPCRIPIES